MSTTRLSSTPARLWLGPVIALVIGVPILLWGLLATAAPTMSWFVPLCVSIAVVSMIAVALLGGLDVQLRSNLRSLPIVFIASATVVMWTGQFVTFPGDIPGLGGDRLAETSAATFLGIALLTPLLLFFALLVRDRPLARPSGAILMAIGGGVSLGLLVIGLALWSDLDVIMPSGKFSGLVVIAGVAALIPGILGLLAFVAGLRGDERIAGGVLAALTFTVLNSVALIYLVARYTPDWYADNTLSFLPFVALFAGQLWLYTGSVMAEREASAEAESAAERRRIGLDIAQAMATETDPQPVVDRLLSGVMKAIDADRVTMLRLVNDGYVVERSIDRAGQPASIGSNAPLDSVTAGGRKVVAEAVSSKTPQVFGPYHVSGIDAAQNEAHAGIKCTIAMPLVRGGVVDGVLIAGRRSERPFTQADVDQLQELGAIAAQLIRNARLLSETESTSRAKSSFISLAAHELGTPISVIRGYTEMISDQSLGLVPDEQRGPFEAIKSTISELADRVDQLLIATRLELSGSSPAPSAYKTFDLAEVVRWAVDRAQKRADLIHADLKAVLPNVEVMAGGDEGDVGIVLDNLLNNAMTYSHPPIRIEVEVREDRPEVRVRDNGIGIPDEARERIFDQFYRVDNVEFGYPSGTGLGLYISRRLAEQIGGQLLLERTSGEGSEFVLRLRRASGTTDDPDFTAKS